MPDRSPQPAARRRDPAALAILAAIPLLMALILIGAMSGHRVATSVVERERRQEELAGRIQRQGEIALQAQLASAPGDDVFLTGDAAIERIRLTRAAADLEAAIEAARTDLAAAADEHDTTRLEREFILARRAAEAMVGEAGETLDAYEAGDESAATVHMAEMDRQLGLVFRIVAEMNRITRDLQLENFSRLRAETVHLTNVTRLAFAFALVVVATGSLLLLRSRRALVESHRRTLAAAADLRARDAELRAAYQDLELVNEALDEHSIVSVTDASGRILAANEKFREVTGYEEHEILGNTHRLIRSGHHPPSFFAEMWGTITKGEIWRGEIHSRRKDGGYFWVAATIVPFEGRDGRIGKYVAIRTDITALKDMQDRLRELNLAAAHSLARAEKATRSKADFLATMSHEIRTPMSGVIGLNELLLDTRLTSEQRHYVRMAKASAESLLVIVNDILDFSKIEAGRMELEILPFEPRRLIGDLADMHSYRAEEKGLSFEVVVDDDVPAFLASDATRVRQILVNLVNNAIKFTEKGGVTVHAAVDAREGDSVVLRLSVEDTGVGLDDDEAAALFQRYRQADASTARRFGGTGLGLSIVRSLAEAMGGEAGVRSAKGAGSTFWATIRCAVAKPPKQEVDESRAETIPSVVLPGLAVLVADDNAVNLLVAKRLLEKLGCRVETARDGSEAIFALQAGDFDVVLMDCHMPNVNGFEATRLIRDPRTGARNPRVPVIALTAAAMAGDREKCLAAGMDDYVTKPLARRDLVAALERRTASGSASRA